MLLLEKRKETVVVLMLTLLTSLITPAFAFNQLNENNTPSEEFNNQNPFFANQTVPPSVTETVEKIIENSFENGFEFSQMTAEEKLKTIENIKSEMTVLNQMLDQAEQKIIEGKIHYTISKGYSLFTGLISTHYFFDTIRNYFTQVVYSEEVKGKTKKIYQPARLVNLEKLKDAKYVWEELRNYKLQQIEKIKELSTVSRYSSRAALEIEMGIRKIPHTLRSIWHGTTFIHGFAAISFLMAMLSASETKDALEVSEAERSALQRTLKLMNQNLDRFANAVKSIQPSSSEPTPATELR